MNGRDYFYEDGNIYVTRHYHIGCSNCKAVYSIPINENEEYTNGKCMICGTEFKIPIERKE